MFSKCLRNYYSKLNLLPKGRRGNSDISLVHLKHRNCLPIYIVHNFPMFLKLCLQVSLSSMEEKNKPIFPIFMPALETNFCSFLFCFLCMDNCFKLYLIFSSLVVGNAMPLLLLNQEMALSLKEEKKPNKNKTPHTSPKIPTQTSQHQMLSLLSFYGCVTRTCMLLIPRDSLLCLCNTGSVFVFSKKEEILKIVN